MIVPDREFTHWMGPPRQAWQTNRLRFVANWPSPGDLLAEELGDDFFGAYSHEEGQGILRIADRTATPGMDIWSWGYPPPPERQREYTLSPGNLGYVEMWGGTATNFTDEARAILPPGQSRQWFEGFVPFRGAAVTHCTTNVIIAFSWNKRDGRILLNLSPIRPGRLTFVLRHNGTELTKKNLNLTSPRSFKLRTRAVTSEPPHMELWFGGGAKADAFSAAEDPPRSHLF